MSLDESRLSIGRVKTFMRSSQKNLTILAISFSKGHLFKKISEGKLLIRTPFTTLLEIFFKLVVISNVIFKSIMDADDTFPIDL